MSADNEGRWVRLYEAAQARIRALETANAKLQSELMTVNAARDRIAAELAIVRAEMAMMKGE